MSAFHAHPSANLPKWKPADAEAESPERVRHVLRRADHSGRTETGANRINWEHECEMSRMRSD